ncbi:MAG: lasso peptide biosynthesis B2 protein [Planctomycetia bacterium]|nr:lasso peptide biosynthesis B2 protein [Planctomycetia bacterium]
MGDLALRAHVWAVASIIPLLVRVCSLKNLLNLLGRASRRTLYGHTSAERIAETVNRRLRAPRNMRRRACLRKGLTMYYFLRLAGMPAVLHFAVHPWDRPSDRMHAHCWVTVDGTAMSEAAPEPFSILLEHGADSEVSQA